MLESIYRSQTFIQEIDRSPYGPFVRQLTEEYLRDGFKPGNFGRPFGLIVRFVRWAAHKRKNPNELRAKHICEFLEEVQLPGKIGPRTLHRRGFERLAKLIEAKHGHRLIVKPIPPHLKNPNVVGAVDDFKNYMRDVRGLTPTSMIRFSTTLAQFLTHCFPLGKVRPTKIRAKDILDFFQERGRRFQHKTLQSDGSALRCYLRYLYGKGIIPKDLSYAVPKVASWRNQSTIHTLTEEEMAKILRTCNLDEAAGVRDYAVLILLMRYGLRPIEVGRLRLDDIRWDEKKILIRGKGRKGALLPLEPEVATALNRYINAARPRSSEQVVFLRVVAPLAAPRPSSVVSHIVHRAILRAGLNPKTFGARLIRYSVASKILNSGGNLMEVAELLRHTSIDTSARYMRLDLRRLSMCALSWPDGRSS